MAWRWDQGRIAFFQFDEIRKMAKFAVRHDLKTAKRKPLVDATGLPFRPIDDDYPPWRNYSRVFRAAMLIAEIDGVAKPTAVAHLLAADGQVTSDEYFHFLAQAFTDPAPSFKGWKPTAKPRFPLLFTLKFLLARANIGSPVVDYAEIVGAYAKSSFVGVEDQAAFIGLAKMPWTNAMDHRQARESIQVISQISYLSATATDVTVSLDLDDALDVFRGLEAVRGKQTVNRDAEIVRRADLYEGAVAGLELEYHKTVLDQAVEAGFSEGTRVERTHLILERNGAVRSLFFSTYPGATCNFCARDTGTEYPWTERVLDIHHVLPLCSGTRSTLRGTVLTDLVAICPTCHRAVHRYYAKWLNESGTKDFADAKEAQAVYASAKSERKQV